MMGHLFEQPRESCANLGAITRVAVGQPTVSDRHAEDFVVVLNGRDRATLAHAITPASGRLGALLSIARASGALSLHGWVLFNLFA
jgi:hypothetical protein